MGNNSIYFDLFRDRSQFIWLKYWDFIWPIVSDILDGTSCALLHPIVSIDTSSTSYAQNLMPISRNDTIVRNRFPAGMVNPFLCKVCRVVVIPSHKHNPIIGFTETPRDGVVDMIIIGWFVKAKTTISCNYQQSIGTTIANAQFVYKCLEVSVDIA